MRGRLVVRWVTTGEHRLLYVSFCRFCTVGVTCCMQLLPSSSSLLIQLSLKRVELSALTVVPIRGCCSATYTRSDWPCSS
ncbi:hypothetical protein M440DRAFT_1052427 [Trichoderma longibrachiatum ATCC 18648]|uniref:Uncharacterized protein n=1 Tax=Trichoderma longibrachiatum ATCC 18648 TaxID=983965 RepID=A0A2T4BWX8_TRILO|nr:hypothetical protein M440DRAFT_1052427 [Trichoderma longibrachiatum ATCC 18648]